MNAQLKPAIMRAPKNHRREPLKSSSEIAEMLGISIQSMASTMQHYPAPTAEISLSGTANRSRARYYRPSLMRKWWVGVQSSRNKQEAIASHE